MRHLFEPRILFRAAVTAVLLALLAWRIDLAEAGRALGAASYIFLLPAAFAFGASKLLVAQRWRVMMPWSGRPTEEAGREGVDGLPLAPLFGILCVSNLANNVLPARLGDLVRVQVPAQRYGLSRARLAAAVFATESLLDGLAFAGLGAIGLALIDIRGFPAEVFWVALGVIGGSVIAVVPISHLQPAPGWTERGAVRRLPARVRAFAEETLPHFLDGLAVFRHGRLAAQAVGLSFAVWLVEVGMFALLGRAFGITLSMPAWMLVMVAANLVSAVPVTPSNIGAYEVAITELLKALGVEPGAAAAFAIAAHAFNIAWISVAGLVSMWALGLSFEDVFSLRGGEQSRDERAGTVPRAL